MNPLVSDLYSENALSLLPRDFPVSLGAVVASDVKAALAEDIGPGDLTASLIPSERLASASVIAREAGVLCGRAWFDTCFFHLDPTARIVWSAKDGDGIEPGQTLCKVEGAARALLSAERSALNFLQLLSGVATKTRVYAEVVQGTVARVVDTRKTLPGLRAAQKYAVRIGGGDNHRFALWDAILIKENHIMAAGSIALALREAHKVAATSEGRCRFVQIEVETQAQLIEALAEGARMVLLDNFNLHQLREAVAYNTRSAAGAVLEASGGIDLGSLRAIAETGINRISIGGLTKDVKALDLSMRFQVEGRA